MSHDLQIEDLVAQNEAEVVFSAIHAADLPVMLRRFFPYGLGGRGLLDAEREVFETVVRRLVDCRHPALCAVVAGGVDPVDGMPFVALERISGDSLEEVLRHGPLSPQDAIALLESLLGAAGFVSTALGHDGLWLETESQTIQWTDRGHGPAPVFRIAPYRCLWTGEDWRPAADLIRLTEVALGWQGVMVADQAADGLGAWMNWLRTNPSATVAESLVSLAAATRRTSPPVPPIITQAPAVPLVPRSFAPRRRSKAPLLALVAGLALMAGGASWWLATRPPRLSTTAAKPVSRPHASHVGEIPAAAAAPGPRPSASVVSAERPPAPAPTTIADATDRVFQAGEIDLIMARFRREIVMEGVVVRVSLSANRKIWYLEFSNTRPPDQARAFLPVRDKGAAGDVAEVNALVGKRVRVRGKVDLERTGPARTHRPKVLLKERAALEVIG